MWCGHLYADRLGGIWHHKLRIPRRHAELHMLLAKIVVFHASDANHNSLEHDDGCRA